MKKIVATVFILLSLVCLSAYSDDDREQDEALKLRQQGKILPLEKILQAARNVHEGRILEVELQHEHKLYIYEIELVDSQGQVWEMKINAVTAKVISSERED